MSANLFSPTGIHTIVDGQFGSTGKGALAAFLAGYAVMTGDIEYFAGCITSAGPNSGHTSYFGDNKIVLKQLPTFAVQAHLMGCTIPIYLSAGAVINPMQLAAEASQYPKIPIFVHPCATVVSNEDVNEEFQGNIFKVAGTRSGTGAALARKIKRDPTSVWANGWISASNVVTLNHRIKPSTNAYFMEVSQGFSLGINTEEFYPKVTSRECTVMQGLADARLPPSSVAHTYMNVRTFPIRVGNADGFSSGDWYPDQEEVTWESIGVEPEMTTNTKRIRRVATFSDEQFLAARRANDPDWISLNFLNYVKGVYEQREMIDHIRWLANAPMPNMIVGKGPRVEDWSVL